MARVIDQVSIIAEDLEVDKAVELARKLVRITGLSHMVEEGNKEKVYLADMTEETLVLQENKEGWHRVVAAGDAVGRSYGDFLTPDETAGAKARFDTVVFGMVESEDIPAKMEKMLFPLKKEIDKLSNSKKLQMMDHVSAFLLAEERGKGKASEFETDNVFSAFRRAMDLSVPVSIKMKSGSAVKVTPKLAKLVWNKYEVLKPAQKMAYQILMGKDSKSFAEGVRNLAVGKRLKAELPQKKTKSFMSNWAGDDTDRSPLY